MEEREEGKGGERRNRNRVENLNFPPWGNGTSPHNKLQFFEQTERNSFHEKVTSKRLIHSYIVN